MKNYRLKAFCKINLSLRVLKKNKNGYHSLQSFVTFGNLYDDIYVKKCHGPKDKIVFLGKFKSLIDTKSNTVTKLLKLLRDKHIIKKKTFNIIVKKNIPHGSGLGGGSSDAAALLNFFKSKINTKMKKNDIYKLANKIGSDVSLCLEQKNSLITGKKFNIIRLNSRFKFNILIVFAKIICPTKKVYLKNRQFSSKKFVSQKILNNKKKLINYLRNEHNDLEKTVINMYPKIGRVISLISEQKGCYLSRLTGSGSACIGLFSSLKNANLAKKNIKKNFPKYWCAISKTI